MGITDSLLKRTKNGQGKTTANTPPTFWSKNRGWLMLAAAGVLLLAYPFLPFISDYWIDVAFFVGIYALLGLSLNIVLGEVGLFDLGHTAFYAIGAYVTAILNTTLHVPIIILLPISALVAAGFAFLVTSPIIHLKGDYLCIVTIGIGEIVRLTMINNPLGLARLLRIDVCISTSSREPPIFCPFVHGNCSTAFFGSRKLIYILLYVRGNCSTA